MRKKWVSLLMAAVLTMPLGLSAAAAQNAAEDGVSSSGGSVTTAVYSSGPAVLWVPTNTEKVLRSQPAPEEGAKQTIDLEAAKNEYESGQVIVRANDAALTGVTVETTALVHDGGDAQIDAEDVHVYKQHYVEVTSVTSGAYPKGWYPDALVPMGTNESFDVGLGQNQGIWLTVKVPKNQPPGLYRGNVAVRAQGVSFDVPMTLNVWDFELSDEGHTQSAFAIWYDQVAYYHNVAPNTPEYWQLLENYYWFQTEYRLPPDDLPIPSGDVDQYIAQAERFLSNPKVNSFRIPYYENDLPKTKQLVDKLREKGWLSKGYFYLGGLIDEPPVEKYPLVRQLSEELTQIAPDVKHVVTKEPNALLEGYVNTWAPLLHLYEKDYAQARQAAGDHVWWYTCVIPKHPYPSYHIDDDLLGARLLSWMQRENKVEGNLFWSTTIFRKYNGTQYVDRNVWQDPLAFPGANGDGFLLYPGKELGINGPVATIRIEAIREGMEDYEYLWSIEDRMRSAAASLGLASFDVDAAMKPYYDRLYKSVSSYNERPEELLQVRREIAEQIVALEQDPTVLFTVTRLEDLKQRITVYAAKDAAVQLNGQTVQAAEQHPQYDVYAQTFDLQIGVNPVELTVTANGAAKSQTIRLIGIAPAPVQYVVPMLDAESSGDVDRWTLENVELSRSADHAAQGDQSLKAVYQPDVDFPNMKLFHAGTGFRSADWSKYNMLEFDVYNDEETSQLLYIKFFDESGGVFDGTTATVGPKASKKVQIPMVNIGIVDKTNMAGFELWMWKQSAPVTLYYDNFRFLASEKLPPQDLNYHYVYQTSVSDMTIDGSLNEDAWQTELEYKYTAFGATDNKGKLGLLWNSQYLYASFEIEDGDVRDPSHGATPWEDDGVEIFIDGDYVKGPRNEHAPQYTVRFNDNQVFLNGASSPSTSGILQKSKRTPTGYTMEMAIPWTAIGVTAASGKTIGVTSHINDDDMTNGVRAYGVLGFTPYGLDDGATTANWGEFILSPDAPQAAQGEIAASEYKFTDLLETKTLQELKKSDSVLAGVTLENRYAKAKELAFVVELLDHKNKAENRSVVVTTLQPGQKETFKAGFELPKNANKYKVKVSVWDNLQNRKPYVADVVFP